MTSSARAGAQRRVEVTEPADPVEPVELLADRLASAADVTPDALAGEAFAGAESPAGDPPEDARTAFVVLTTGAWAEQEPDQEPAGWGEVAPGVLRRAVEGDDRAFAAIVEHYDPMLRQLTFHVLGERAAMDEVLQIAYVKAYRALPRLTAGAEAGPWLYRIAYLVCLDELRRKYRHPGRDQRPQRPEEQTSTPPPAVDEAEPSAFGRAFSGLPADQRAAVLLVDRAGLGIEAVAGVLGVAEASTSKLLGRARAVLHAALDEAAPEPDLDVR